MSKSDKSKQQPKVNASNSESLRGLDEETLIGVITRLVDQNRELSELLQSFLQEKYGQKTERFTDPDQLRLFGGTTAEQSPGATEKEQKSKPKRKGTTRQRNPQHSNLPHVRVNAKQVCPADLVCACCGRSLVKVNEVVVRSRYDYKPASIRVEDLVEDVFACPACEESVVSGSESVGCHFDAQVETIETPTINWETHPGVCLKVTAIKSSGENVDDSITPAIAAALVGMRNAVAGIARCGASPSLLSYIAVSKYCDHLPLYRLEQIFARHGADISRSTMCGWLALLSNLLRGIYDLMHAKLLLSKVIRTDDTPVKVLDRLIKKKIKIGRMWVYIGDKDHPFIMFNYTPGRARAGPRNFLRGFKKYLQGDCFSGNEAICAENGAILVACNAHARRYFKKALLNYKSKSEEALRMFRELFKIESDAKELGIGADDLKLMREQEAKPLLDNFKKWLDAEHVAALPKSAFGKAVNYCLNNWSALTAYLMDGDLSIDNNAAEQQMKRVAMGRKGWLFFGSDSGGERAEVLMSIIETCKMHDVEPWAYIKDVVGILVANPQADLEALLPTNWRTRSNGGHVAQSGSNNHRSGLATAKPA